MVVIGLLAGIAVPRYGEMKRRAIAAAIMGDVHAVRIAAFSYYTENGMFPPDAGAGMLPPQLVANLPNGFTFDRPDFDYDWHVWTIPSGSGSETLVGVTVICSDPLLAAQIVKTAGAGYVPIVTPTRVTLLVSSAS